MCLSVVCRYPETHWPALPVCVALSAQKYAARHGMTTPAKRGVVALAMWLGRVINWPCMIYRSRSRSHVMTEVVVINLMLCSILEATRLLRSVLDCEKGRSAYLIW